MTLGIFFTHPLEITPMLTPSYLVDATDRTSGRWTATLDAKTIDRPYSLVFEIRSAAAAA